MMNFLRTHFKKYLGNYSGVPASCWGSIALVFIQYLANAMCYFVSLYFTGELNVDVATVGIMLSCYGVGTVCGGIVAGKLCDQFFPKMISVISLVLEAGAFISLALLTNSKLVMLNMFVLGVAISSFNTSNNVWMLAQCGSNEKLRVKVINLSRVAMNLGLGISGALIGLFAAHGFANIFYSFGLMIFLASIYLVMQRNKDMSLSNEITSSNAIQEPNNRILYVTLFCLFCAGLMFAQLGSTYPIYLVDTFPDLGMKAVSFLYLLDTFIVVFVQAPLSNAMVNYNKMIIMGVGAFMMGVGMLILSFSHVFALAIVSCIVWTTGEMLFVPMSQLLCYENGGAKKKGQAMGLYQTIYASSVVFGPAAGGFIYHNMSGNTVWYLCAFIGCMCLLLCLYFTHVSWFGFGFYANASAQEG